MHINHILRRFREPSGLGRVIGGTLLSAVMLLQPFNSAWAVDRLSTGQSWFVLNETGIDTLGVQRLRITGPDAEAFTIEGYSGSPTGMTPSQDVFTPALVQKTPSTPLGVNLRFTPQHSGTHQASLEVTHDGTNASPQIYPLTGNGNWDLTVDNDAGTIDFGTRAMGMPAVTQDGFLRSAGAHGWLTVTGMKLEGSPDFTLAQAGLVNKGTTAWSTGANLDVLPADSTESVKQFKGADLSVGGLTDAAARVRYTPNSRGPQSAKLTVYHDAPGAQSEYLVTAEGVRGVSVAVNGANPHSSTVLVPVQDFTRAGQYSSPQSKAVYLQATGAVGSVTYTGIRVEGASNITVTSVALTGTGVGRYPGICKDSYTASPLAIPTPDENQVQTANFSLKGTPVQSLCQYLSNEVTSVPHLAVNLKFDPKTIGTQTAKVTIFHDGNDQGYSTFEVSGETYRDIQVELTGANPNGETVPVSDFAQAAVGGTVTKTVYLKVTGTYGWVTFDRFSVEGASDIKLTSVARYGRIYNPNTAWACMDGAYSTHSVSQDTLPSGGQAGALNLVGSNVNVTCWRGTSGYTPAYPHLALTFTYTPKTVDTQTAKVSIFHDGNDQGFTEFELSGKAFSNVVLTPSESPNASVMAPSAMPDTYIGLPVTKSIYLRATGPNGAVTYQGVDVSGTPGARIVGAYSVVKGGSAVTGANLVQVPGASVQFQLKGADVSTTGYTDLRVDVEFTPEQAGEGQLNLTFYHNAPRLTTQVSLTTAAEDLAGRATIQNNGSFRSWSDDTFATSCESYRRPTAGDRVYAGYSGSGTYRINVAAGPLDVYCDMESDGGGWTRIVRQFEASPVATWTGGSNGASYALSAAQIPAHTQVGFGRDELATDVDFVDWTYSTGDIPVPVLVISPKSGLSYQVHRQTSACYGYHDPEGTRAVADEWKNTLTFDRVGGVKYTWAFAPLTPTVAYRGYAYNGAQAYSAAQPYAWTVWVR